MPVRSLHLSGYFKKNDNKIILEFCTNIGSPIKFPKGSYCVYRKFGVCPPGFVSSSAQIDDEDNAIYTSRPVSGFVPDGVYEADSKYYFCCRNDGDVNSTIELPFNKSFYLFKSPHSKTCQKVKGFRETHEVLVLDTEDEGELGKPPVIINGSVPMTRSSFRGSDVDVHYCYYRNINSIDTGVKLRLIKVGLQCPPGTNSTKYKLLGNKYRDVCAITSKTIDQKFPPGDYCLLSDFNKECPINFYNVRSRYFTNLNLPHPVQLMVCCRENPKGYTGPLDFSFIGDHSFGLVASSCPRILGKGLATSSDFYTYYKVCNYVSYWPRTFPFGLPTTENKCPYGFIGQTVGAYFLGETVLWNIFNDSKTSTLKQITNLKICFSAFHSKIFSTEVKWPKGNYCVFASSKDVVKEFPIALRFVQGHQGKNQLIATFLFCRNDGKLPTTGKLPNFRYFALPTLGECSSVIKSAKSQFVEAKSVLKLMPPAEKDIYNGSRAYQPSKEIVNQLKFCVIGEASKPSSDAPVFEKHKINPKCECISKTATCVAGKCRCNTDNFGDGEFCFPCNCARTATCLKGQSYFSRRCRCILGSSGDGHSCSSDAYTQTVVTPDTKILDWPEGRFSFLKTYDNIDCPKGFSRETSSAIGRNEHFQFSMAFESTLCSKKTKEGNGLWPKGNYCVWAPKDGICPKALKTRTIFLPYKNVNEADAYIRKQKTSTGSYSYVVTFCCMFSTEEDTVLTFPPVNFFTLLKVNHKCPDVKQMIKSEEQFVLSRGLTYTTTDGQKGPSAIVDTEFKFIQLSLCNYYIHRLTLYPRNCNQSSQKLICWPSKDLVEVIEEEDSLSNLKKVLESCKFIEKLKKLHHVQITLFIQNEVLNSNTRKLSKLNCHDLKNQILITKLPMSFMVPKLNDTGINFLTISSDYVNIKKSNMSGDYLFGNQLFDKDPVIVTKNGLIYSLKRTPIHYTTTLGAPKKTSMIIGIIISLLVVAAAVCLVSYWFFKRRQNGTPISSFMNPVYYSRVDATQ